MARHAQGVDDEGNALEQAKNPKHYSIWKHPLIASCCIVALIFGTTGCSQLSEEEIANLVASEVSKQISLDLENQMESEVERQVALIDVVQGAQGVQGPKGLKGATGLTGPTGPVGPMEAPATV